MKKTIQNILCGALSLALLISSAPLAHAATPFTDVSSGSWYASYVDYAYNNKLMAGTSDTQFQPNQTMTRGMLVTVLHSIAGKPSHSGTNPFSDIANSWYTNAVLWCYDNGIVAGTSQTTFDPNSSITREQMVAIMFKFAGHSGLNTQARADLSGYTDEANITAYAKDGFAWSVEKGVISGTSDTTLSPKDNATRAECAVILQRYHELLNAKPEPSEPAPTEPTPTEPAPSEPIPTPPYATPTDKEFPYIDKNEQFKREISEWTIHYINEFRKAEGTTPAQQLPGLTLVSEYRADQLTVNYGHILEDMNESLAYYKYGRYVDVSNVPGFDPSDSYYEVNGQEAIASGGIASNDTAKDIALNFAKSFYSSKGHWSYVGNAENQYIGVGFEFDEKGSAKCCVFVASTNHDNGWVNPHN